MSAKQDVVFYCWRCGQKLAVPDSMQGKMLHCPRCQRAQTVPSGDEGAQKRDVPVAPPPPPPPEPVPDELVATENDMTFTCIHCDWILIMDKRGAGMTVPCPGCGRLITAPQPQEEPPPQGDAAAREETAPGVQD